MRFRIPAFVKFSFCIGLLLMAWTARVSAQQSCGTQCGIGCPATCFPQSTRQSSACRPNNVETVCGRVAGSQLNSCGKQCPSGYYVSALRENSSDCRVGYNSEQVDCRQVSGSFLFQRIHVVACRAGEAACGEETAAHLPDRLLRGCVETGFLQLP